MDLRAQAALEQEEFKRRRDHSAQRAARSPCRRVEKNAVFEAGRQTALSDLFAEVAAPRLSISSFIRAGRQIEAARFWADNSRHATFTEHANVSFLAMCAAPLPKLEPIDASGGGFKWVLVRQRLN